MLEVDGEAASGAGSLRVASARLTKGLFISITNVCEDAARRGRIF